jgi:acyl-CoA synthetase (AMP-forming)/AMP-acid ligase II
MAASAPNQVAIVVSKRRARSLTYESLTFSELESLSNRYANGLTGAGITREMRTLLMVRQGFDFVALVFALFKIGAVPVLIDPGMGVARLLDCIRTVSPEAFVGIPLAHAVRVLCPGAFRTVKHAVTVGHRWFWAAPTLSDLACNASVQFAPAPTTSDETAAILFTSGSTGPAKGVVYQHGMFDAQVRMIQSTYNIQPGEIDLPTFPLFALFSVAMGMTIVLPDMDPSHPARVNPANIVDAIRDQKVSNTFGSPALWKRVAAYCVERSITLPTLRRILIAGAPVPPQVIEQLHQVLARDADVHTPYGATESLPVSTISGNEVVGRALPAECRVHLDAPSTAAVTLHGAGTCVGQPVHGTQVRIIRITDDPIGAWSDAILAPAGQVGEICVSGPAVTTEYFNLPRANAISKINEGATTWHRIGDVGYFDDLGRLWFCGRKAHRVQTLAGALFTECIEPIFNQHPAVARCALVGVGPRDQQTPVLIVEPKPGQPRRNHSALAADIVAANQYRDREGVVLSAVTGLKSLNSLNRQSTIDNRQFAIAHQQLALFQSQISNRQSTIDNRQSPILFHRSLPVDIRHNAKINRELLAAWAASRIQFPE